MSEGRDSDLKEEARPRAGPPSGPGVRYTALSFSERLMEIGITPSMRRTWSALDNAMAESFVWSLKA